MVLAGPLKGLNVTNHERTKILKSRRGNTLCPEHGVKRLHTAKLAWLGPPEGGPAKAVRLHRWCAGLVSDN